MAAGAASREPDDGLGRRVTRKVALRLIPFLCLLYFFSFLDRVNVGFAALTMNADIGLSALAFGVGSGIFFLGYVLFEVPSNIALERFGARIWIARIMITWGLVSAATAFVQGPASFAMVRLLLGIAEAGFFPGIIYYLTCWFPAAQRARIIALFLIALPLSSVIGAPLSTALLDIEWFGLHGWQWMFILEAVPTILLGIAVLLWLTDRPEQAHWLDDSEKAWLTGSLDGDDATNRHHSIREVMGSPRVWAAGAMYFGVLVGLYGFGFWMPQIIASFGELSHLQVGFATMVPYTAACIAMVFWGRHSDRKVERLWHVALPALAGATALLASAVSPSTPLAFGFLVLAAMGIYAALPAFWALVTQGMRGVAAAAAIALINSIGNLGGFLGPAAIGFARDSTGSHVASLVLIAACLLMTAAVTLTVFRRRPGTPA
jgi:ACS family tartrate transporter-like MFS transporter